MHAGPMSHSAFDLIISRVAVLTAERALEFLPSEAETDLAPAAPSWLRHLLGECHRDLSPSSSNAFNPMHVDLDPLRVEQVHWAVQVVAQKDGEDWMDVVVDYADACAARGGIEEWAASHERRRQYGEKAKVNYDIEDEQKALEAGRYEELEDVGTNVVRYFQTNITSDVLPTDRTLVSRLLEDRDPNDASAPLTALTYLDAVGESLRPEQLARVLAHPDSEVRKRAFRVAARVREPEAGGPVASR